MSMGIPETAGRLFAHATDLGDASSRRFLIGRILEEGDSADLRWLVGEVGEEAVVEWVKERGGRQLSRRSRFFWERVLRVGASPVAEVAEALWPL